MKSLGNSSLHYVALKGDANSAELLLAAGADPDSRDKNGETPLHCVARSGYIGVARSLIAYGASVTVRDEVGLTPLHIAAAKGHIVKAKKQWFRGDFSTQSWFDYPSYRIEVVEHEVPFHEAVGKNYTGLIELLIRAGANVNAIDDWGTTPLCFAAWAGHMPGVMSLLEHGADVDPEIEIAELPAIRQYFQRPSDKRVGAIARNVSDSTGFPLRAISRAFFNKDIAMMAILLGQGADVHACACPDLYTLAYFFGYEGGSSYSQDGLCDGEAWVALVNLRGDLIEVNPMGRTFLHDAAFVGFTEAVILLLAHGADINARTRNGMTPIGWAKLGFEVLPIGRGGRVAAIWWRGVINLIEQESAYGNIWKNNGCPDPRPCVARALRHQFARYRAWARGTCRWRESA